MLIYTAARWASTCSVDKYGGWGAGCRCPLHCSLRSQRIAWRGVLHCININHNPPSINYVLPCKAKSHCCQLRNHKLHRWSTHPRAEPREMHATHCSGKPELILHASSPWNAKKQGAEVESRCRRPLGSFGLGATAQEPRTAHARAPHYTDAVANRMDKGSR